jgi:hypothetical protein
MNLEAADRYFEALTGETTPTVGIICIHDKDRDQKPHQFYGPPASWWEDVSKLNDQGYGVFVYVNELDGKGFKNENVTSVRAVFVDKDNGPFDMKDLPVKPTLMVHSGHGDHAYWVIENEAQGNGLEHFEEMQLRMAWRLGTDDSVKNLARVMRMPGSDHHKDHIPKPVAVSVFDQDDAFIYSELVDAFGLADVQDPKKRTAPANVPPPPPPPHPDATTQNRASPRERARAYLQTVDPAIEGAHGDEATFRAACLLVNDFDLSEAEAWPILCEFNGRCSPPWGEEELLKKLRNAQKYAKQSPGDKLRAESGSWESPPNPPGAVGGDGPSGGADGQDPDAIPPKDPRLKIFSAEDASAAFFAAGDRTFIPCHVPALNDATGGGLPVDAVTTILAYTGCYKSEFARNAAKCADAGGFPVVHVDVELGIVSLMERYLAEEAEITPRRLRKHSDWTPSEKARVDAASRELKKSKTRTICPGGGLPLETLWQLISAAFPARGPDEPGLLVLDSAQRLSHGSHAKDARMRVEDLFIWAENIARALHVAVLIIHEQSRTQGGGVPKPGTLLTSGAESRAIEYTSSVLLGLFPDQPDLDDEEAMATGADEEGETPIAMVIGKNRPGGSIGYLEETMVVTKPYWRTSIRPRRKGKSDALLAAMEPGIPYSVKTLRGMVGGRHQTVKFALLQLCEAGHVIKAQYTDKPPTFTLRSDI